MIADYNSQVVIISNLIVSVTLEQCEQMLKLKVAHSYPKVGPKSSHSSFYLKTDVFKEPKKSPYIWANFK